jgi:hypothetical protein
MDAETQIEGFIARYSPEIAAQLRVARAAMRRRLPGAYELVYDNYNALVFAYGSSERASDIVFSIAGYPRWVRLFFAGGATLDDPQQVLEGGGAHVRSVLLATPAILDDPTVQALMAQALARAGPIDHAAPSRALVKSISAKQRPRRQG